MPERGRRSSGVYSEGMVTCPSLRAKRHLHLAQVQVINPRADKEIASTALREHRLAMTKGNEVC